MVRQLYDLKLIGPACPNTGSKKLAQGDTKPFPVVLRQEVERELDRTIMECRLNPTYLVMLILCFSFSLFIDLYNLINVFRALL